jgi:ABC-type multidrug transport system ATPase subunit
MISIENLDYKIGGKVIFNGLNMNIQPGIISTIIGPNGCGKSSLLKIIVGFWEPDSGTIKIYKEELSKQNKQDLLLSFGVLIEEPRLFKNLTVEENIICRQMELGYKRKDLDSYLNLFDIEKFKTVKCGNLSMGNKLKLGLALTLVNNPSFLILDEPTSALDPKSTAEFGKLLIRIKQELKTTICLTSHDSKFFEAISDEIIDLRDYGINEIYLDT